MSVIIPQRRSKMQIICAGFPKTGTKSMARALRELGYVVYDFEEHVDLQMDKYLDFFEGVQDFSELMEAYKSADAVVDQPASILWLIFFKKFPNAKVILMERESSEEWFKSYTKMGQYYIDTYKVWFEDYLPWLSPIHFKWSRFCQHLLARTAALCFPFYRNKFWSKELWIYQYEIHNAAVRQLVPEDQLLIVKTREGWEGLCQFLNKPIPDRPFPKENVGGTPGNIIDQMQEFKTLRKIQSEVKTRLTLAGGILLITVISSVIYWKPQITKSIL